jgi:serine/threonine protein phosphatase PrpC
MKYTTTYDVGERKRDGGINEDSVAVAVFEHGHRDGLGGRKRRPETDDGRGASAPANRHVAAFALADGAGGHDAGDAASYVASTVACEHLTTAAIRAARTDAEAFGVNAGQSFGSPPDAAQIRASVEEAVVAAHRDVLRYARESGTHALTTIVAGVVVDDRLHYGWVGDSRAYVLNGARRELARLTKDHAVVEQLNDADRIDDVEALVHPRSNEITRALGGSGETDPETATVEVDTRSVPLYAEDVLLVTSDGLIDAQTNAPALYERYTGSGRDDAVAERIREASVTDAEIRDRLFAADSLDAAATDLIDLANDRGGKDNLSLILLKDGSLPATPTEGGLPVRAVDPDEPIEDRQTVIVSEE